MEIFAYICFLEFNICRTNQSKIKFIFNITGTQRAFPLMAFYVNLATFSIANWWEKRRLTSIEVLTID